MITAHTQRFPNLHLSTSWKQIVMAAFLSFGLAIPSASAKCFKDFTQALPSPVVTTALANSANQANLATVGPILPLGSASIVGLWNVTFSSGGQTVDVAFDAWHSDGTEILNDYTNPIEGNVCLGVYEQTGPRTYKLKHPSWAFDTTGTLLGTVVIKENVQVSLDGNSYRGNYTYDIYDTNGTFVEELSGQISATRIKPD